MALSFPAETGLFIDGRFRPASDGATFDVANPATEEALAPVADGTVDDALAAVRAAAAAQPGWAATPPRERAEILRRCYEGLIAREEAFARLITLENGKPLADARGELRYAAEFFRWYAEEAVRGLGTLSVAPSSGARILVQHKPAGVALMVTPWNFPAAMGTRKIAPALAAGCTCVLKPAPDTPLTMLAIAQVLAEAGVPTGLVNILPTTRAQATVAAMLRDPAVRVLSFTGSTGAGRALLKEAAEGIVTPRMELGGNAPVLVFDDADLDTAVAGVMAAKMRNMGEACTAANRIFVQQGIYEAFVARFAGAMRALVMGNGLAEGVSVGPLVNAAARTKVAGLVEDALARGARRLVGGDVPAGPGYFYPPTVLTDVPADAVCAREEIFGPVAALYRFAEEDEAVARANDCLMGLAGYVFTADLTRGLRLCDRLEVGMVGINRGLISDPAAPFGGVKQSGLGREGAHEGLLEYVEPQYVSVGW